jgi:cold shock CspA family protein
MLLGLIKWFDIFKGFGIVETSNDGEFFLHIKNFKDRFINLEKGKAVVFNKSIDVKKDKPIAVNCKAISTYEDFKIVLKSLNKRDIITLEKEITGTSYHGNSYTRKENVYVSIKTSAISQLFKIIDIQTIKKFILDYFENELDKKDFIQYCEFIEERINKNVSHDIKPILIQEIFTHFKDKLDEYILFLVWKTKRFKYISYSEKEDFQIPIEILFKFSEELNTQDLKRISEYEYGSKFCETIAIERVNLVVQRTVSEALNLKPLLEFITDQKKGLARNQFTSQLKTAYLAEIKDKTTNLNEIRSKQDFDSYNRLKQNFSNELDEQTIKELCFEIDNIIVSKCLDDFKTDLWLIDLIPIPSFELIKNNFISNDNNKILILKKLPTEKQFELLKLNTENNSFEKTFTIIGQFIKSENSLDYGFQLSEKMFDYGYLHGKIGNSLLDLYNSFTENTASDSEKYALFFKGFYPSLSHQKAISAVETFNENQLTRIFKRYNSNQELIFELIMLKIVDVDYLKLDEICRLAKAFLEKEYFEKFDIQLFNKISTLAYFKLWEDKKVCIFPKAYITSILNDKKLDYEKINIWLEKETTSKDRISILLLEYLRKNESVIDRSTFYRQLFHIMSLIGLDTKYVQNINECKNDFYNVILWFLNHQEYLQFDLLASKFIYFEPNDQVKIIRKLFLLKVQGKLELDADKLNKLTRIDLDLYKTNLKFNPDIPFDISSEIIIKALENYSKTNKFLVEGQLLFLVLGNMNTDKTRKFKLTNYFENCDGRLTAEFNWQRNGVITKVPFGNKFYFAIEFAYSVHLVEEVKKIQGRKWNNATKVWGVPSQYENEVLAFAKDNRFYLDFEGSNYANNSHLAEFKREGIPNGISFCEGRLANKHDKLFKKEFWWCTNQKCFQKCETVHSIENWEEYTMLDFCEILELNTDETNRMGDFIPKGHYYQFISLINRFNCLLERLYCEDCNEILYPTDHSHFAAYSVVRFCCQNTNCRKHKEEIYLNHCLNGQCNSIIDSRVSQRCENGLFICDNCGSCCSHGMLERRLSNLQTTGGYIHPNLIECVKLKLGHLERSEYFCYKCKDHMEETTPDIFHCNNCNVKYDTTKYKFKRIHKNLPKTTVTDNLGNIDDDFS